MVVFADEIALAQVLVGSSQEEVEALASEVAPDLAQINTFCCAQRRQHYVLIVGVGIEGLHRTGPFTTTDGSDISLDVSHIP